MKDVVSFETAKRLKEAGFPQPEYELYFSDEFMQDGYLDFDEFSGNCRYSGDFFAPSATDILPKLYTGVTDGTEWSIVFRGKNWSCVKRQWTEQGQSVFAWYDHENPAEACAAAYLSIHEKTTNQ